MFMIAPLALVATVSAEYCMDIKTVDDFKFKEFGQGIWYQVARYNHPREEGSVCGRAEYTPAGNEFKVKNFFVRNNKEYIKEGIARPDPSGKSGKIQFEYPYGPGGSMAAYTFNVLAIDYDKYAIAYCCNYNKDAKTRQDLAWVFSRTKVLPADAKVAVDKFISESKILDSKKFIWPEFTEEACKVLY